MRASTIGLFLVFGGLLAAGCSKVSGERRTTTEPRRDGAADAPADGRPSDASAGNHGGVTVVASHLEPMPPIDPASCPRPIEGLRENDALRDATVAALREHYGVDENTRVIYDDYTFRGIALGEGTALIAIAFGTRRFDLWQRQMMGTGEWEAIHARAMERLAACRRGNYEACLADFDDPTEGERDCGHLLVGPDDEDHIEEEGCGDIWDDIGPPRGSRCCICDTLVAATFSVRLGADGGPDVETLRLLGEGTVLAYRCNPGETVAEFEIADLDGDDAHELYVGMGKDEHDFERYQVTPYTVAVVRLDGTVQDSLSYPGIRMFAPQDDTGPAKGTWFRFEDRTGDGFPDLTIQHFEVAYDGCSERGDWFPYVRDESGMEVDNPACRLDDDYEPGPCDLDDTEACAAAEAEAAAAAAPTDCIGGTVGGHGWHGDPIPAPPTLWDELPGCERSNVRTQVMVYDPGQDAWRAEDGPS